VQANLHMQIFFSSIFYSFCSIYEQFGFGRSGQVFSVFIHEFKNLKVQCSTPIVLMLRTATEMVSVLKCACRVYVCQFYNLLK